MTFKDKIINEFRRRENNHDRQNKSLIVLKWNGKIVYTLGVQHNEAIYQSNLLLKKSKEIYQLGGTLNDLEITQDTRLCRINVMQDFILILCSNIPQNPSTNNKSKETQSLSELMKE